MPIPANQPTPTPAASPFAPSPFDDGGRIFASAAPAFFLRAHPLSWEVVTVDGSPVWVPSLSRHALLPGSQGIRTLTRAEEGDPRLAWRSARQQQESEGFIYLDPTAEIAPRFRPEGVNASTYCYAIPCIDAQRRPGVRFTELWNVPIPTPVGMSQAFKFDHARANAWRASLVAEGLIPRPNPLIIERAVRRANTGLSRALAGPAGAARDEAVAKAEERLALHTNAAIPEPTKSKPKRRKIAGGES